MEDKKYIAIEFDCDQWEYDVHFEMIEQDNALAFTGNRDYKDVLPTWFDDIRELYVSIDDTFSNSYNFDFIEDFAGCLNEAQYFVNSYKDTLAKYNINLKVADIFAIIDYRQSLYNDTTCRDNIKPKLDFNIIEYKYGYDFTTGGNVYETGEVLDIANYLFKGNIECHTLRGYNEIWYCFSVENNDKIFSDYDYEYIKCVIFGGLYEYRLYEVKKDDVSEIDFDALIDNQDELDIAVAPYTVNLNELFTDVKGDITKVTTEERSKTYLVYSVK